jgi:chromosome segregation ATPase
MPRRDRLTQIEMDTCYEGMRKIDAELSSIEDQIERLYALLNSSDNRNPSANEQVAKWKASIKRYKENRNSLRDHRRELQTKLQILKGQWP